MLPLGMYEYISSIKKILCMEMVDSKFRRAVNSGGEGGVWDKKGALGALATPVILYFFEEQFDT